MKAEKLIVPAVKGFAGATCAGMGAMGFILGGHRGDLHGIAILAGIVGAGGVLLKQAASEIVEVIRES